MERPLIGVICDASVPMRPFAELLRDRSQHLMLLPCGLQAALGAIDELRPDAVVLAGSHGEAFAHAIRDRFGSRAPLLIGTTDEPEGAASSLDERIDPPLTPRTLAALIDRMVQREAS